MSTGKKLVCVGRTYRGVIIVDCNQNDETYSLVVGVVHPRANGESVVVYPCDNRDEAEALIDVMLSISNLPVREISGTKGNGGARAAGSSDDASIFTEYNTNLNLS